MVKRRLIPVLYIKNGLIVRSEDFKTHQLIGNVVNEASRYNDWQVDELIYIDISRDDAVDSGRDDHKIEAVSSKEDILNKISGTCFMPLTFGGKIRTLEDVDFLIKNGADKVTLNTGALENPQLIKQVSEKYGSQAVVLSIDYRLIDKKPVVFSTFGTVNTELLIFDWIREAELLGAGELFINAIERDGKGSGYDIGTIGEVVSNTKLPVIACGGAADEYDFLDLAEQTNVSGIAAGNWFHFVEHSYPRAKKLLKKNNIHVR